MAYSAGDTILDDEYNNFLGGSSGGAYGINHIMGTGSGVYGLGQSTVSTVSAGDTINASQWNSLFTAMDNIANHTNISISSTSAKSAGDSIAIISALNTDLQSLATAVAGGCTGMTAVSTGSELQSSTSSTRWTGSHTVEHSITFASANNLRFFFNAGGKIRFSFTRNGNGAGGATSKDSSVDELVSAMGNFDMGSTTSTRSGSGETVTTNGLSLGAADLTTSYQTLLRLTQSSGTYTSMFIDVQAKINASYGSGTVITMRYQISDPDSGDSSFTSGNTSGVEQYANFVGQTDMSTRLRLPTTGQGLSTVYTLSSSAVVSNSTS